MDTIVEFHLILKDNGTNFVLNVSNIMHGLRGKELVNMPLKFFDCLSRQYFINKRNIG